MARKFKLNEDKFKVAFIFANEGCNPKKDRSIIESEKIIMYVVGCADYSQAETSILLSETKAAMISSKRIFGVLGFRTNRRTDETREIIFLYL